MYGYWCHTLSLLCNAMMIRLGATPSMKQCLFICVPPVAALWSNGIDSMQPSPLSSHSPTERRCLRTLGEIQ